MSPKKIKNITKVKKHKSKVTSISFNNNIGIALEDFSVIFNAGEYDEFKLFDVVNYNFEKGKIHYIIGPSGSGKTVMITHFNGLKTTKYGQIKIGNFPIINKGKKIKHVDVLRKTVGMVFQFAEYQLFKSTIEKDVMFGPVNFGIRKQKAKELAAKSIIDVGLDHSFMQRNPFGLSGGQKRRVAIAGVLSSEPDIIIFDEPTAGLDPVGENEIKNIMVKLRDKGKTIIVVTHSVNHALEIADNVVVVNDKKIMDSGEPYKIFTNKQLMELTNISVPSIIKVIDELIKKDSDYESLLEFKPRTVEDLAKYITVINKGGK